MSKDQAVIKIVQVHTEARRDYVTIVNCGKQPQSLEGWTLVSLRQERAFMFPVGLVLAPGMMMTLHSGQAARENPPYHVLWTRERVWNHIADTAVLFNANGVEVDRFTYPHEHALGSEARHRKRLVLNGKSYRLTNEPIHAVSGLPA